MKRQFARPVVRNKGTLKEVLEKKMKVKSDKDTRLPSDDLREDPNDPDIDDKRVASLHLKTQILPEVILKRVAKVFGQYPHAELRNMGLEYLKFYQLLHAVERPVDLTEFEKVAADELDSFPKHHGLVPRESETHLADEGPQEPESVPAEDQRNGC